MNIEDVLNELILIRNQIDVLRAREHDLILAVKQNQIERLKEASKPKDVKNNSETK